MRRASTASTASAPPTPASPTGRPCTQSCAHKHVTLRLLWGEYREAHPDGYGYSYFCQHYRAWQGRIDVVMRQDHKAGEKLFVDWAGDTLPTSTPRAAS